MQPKQMQPKQESLSEFDHRTPETEKSNSRKPATSTLNVSEALQEWLHEAGVRHAFGIVGGPLAPFFDALVRGPLGVTQTRHEAGAAFAALEYSLCSGTPGCLFLTTGPGFLNALNGIAAARRDGAKMVVISGATAIPLRGRGAAQETSDYTLMKGPLLEPTLFDLALSIASPAELPAALARIGVGMQRSGTFIAHLSLPTSVQSAPLEVALPPMPVVPNRGCSPAAIGDVANALSEGPFAIWAGAGAKPHAKILTQFAEASGARVMCTPRGKGAFPEDHPLYIGTTALGAHASVQQSLAADPVARIIVVGSRLGEVSSLWAQSMVPSHGFVHVDHDPTAFCAAFPCAPSINIHADIGAFLHGLLAMDVHTQKVPPRQVFPETLPAREQGPVRPQLLMQAVQRVVVENSDALVMAESGATFSWTGHHLCFRDADQYRVSMNWASMGHMTSGVIGAAIAGRKAVALVGDGAMLMGNEFHTAVTLGLDAIWIVLNDARQGIVAQGSPMLGVEIGDVSWRQVDFAAMAESLGGIGLRVKKESELTGALEKALASTGPVLIDVDLDLNEIAPMVQLRAASLGAAQAQ